MYLALLKLARTDICHLQILAATYVSALIELAITEIKTVKLAGLELMYPWKCLATTARIICTASDGIPTAVPAYPAALGKCPLPRLFLNLKQPLYLP